jgi:hypothetical protein
MRRRNPWVLARRRLFGWKVRLLTRRLLAFGTSGSACSGYQYYWHERRTWRGCPRTSVAAGGPLRRNPRRAHPSGDRQHPGKDATEHLRQNTGHPAGRQARSDRAVGDSTEPRYGRATGTVKPAAVAQPLSLSVAGPHPCRDTPIRHARLDKKSALLWTVACCPTHRVVSVARRRATSPPEPGHDPLHPRGAVPAPVTGLRAPCVHRLWMTMWTGMGGVGHDGHNERDQGPIRLSPTVILTRSTARPTRTRG